MHLSLLSSGAFSDLFDDAGDVTSTVARHHFDGVVRGLVFVSVLLAPFILTFAPSAFGHSHRPATTEAHR